MQIQTCRDDHRIAWLAALAITIHIVESALPSPLPGIKPGLANVIVIVVAMRFGWPMGIWISGLRVIAGSLLMGTFLSPTFILSLSGAVGSLLVIVGLSYLPGRGCTAIGYGVASAIGHVLAQFWVAYQMFIQHEGLLRILPILVTAALGFGLVTGFIASKVLEQWESPALK